MNPNDQLAWSSLSIFYVKNGQVPEAEAAGAKARILSWGGKIKKGPTRNVKSFFITTAIDYTNAAPHIGHAYEKILADVIARYHRLKGEPTFFLTGVDQHGQKVQQAAQREGIAAQDFVDRYHGEFRRALEKTRSRATTPGPPPLMPCTRTA